MWQLRASCQTVRKILKRYLKRWVWKFLKFKLLCKWTVLLHQCRLLSGGAYQAPAERWAAWSQLYVCLCIITLCKQDFSQTNLWICAKFIADIIIPYIITWKRSTFGASLTFSHSSSILSYRRTHSIDSATATMHLAADKHLSGCSSGWVGRIAYHMLCSTNVFDVHCIAVQRPTVTCDRSAWCKVLGDVYSTTVYLVRETETT